MFLFHAEPQRVCIFCPLRFAARCVLWRRAPGTQHGLSKPVCFLDGVEDPRITDAEPAFAYDVVARRARKYLGATRDGLPTRNCERFAAWCFAGSVGPTELGVGASIAGAVICLIGIAAIVLTHSLWLPQRSTQSPYEPRYDRLTFLTAL